MSDSDTGTVQEELVTDSLEEQIDQIDHPADGQIVQDVAEDIRKMAVSLGRNDAIDDALPEALHDYHSRLLESVPAEVVVHRE